VRVGTESIRSKIRARLSQPEGYTVEECKKAIAWCWHTWKDDPEMARHIVPGTIFRPEKFPGYVSNFDRLKDGA